MVESSFLLHDEQLKQDLCQDWKRKVGGLRRERREEREEGEVRVEERGGRRESHILMMINIQYSVMM